MNDLNKPLIRSFWQMQASKHSNRWTNRELLEFEVKYLSEIRPKISKSIKILDLGSGSGELSKSLQKEGDILVAVDFEENFKRFFKETNAQFFNVSHVTGFESQEKFELILLYGVVTHLNRIEEQQVYEKITKLLENGGVAIIKHQVSLELEFIINSYSTALGQNYSARYPSLQDTQIKLGSLFREVELLEYPDAFNKFENSKHVAFIVKK